MSEREPRTKKIIAFIAVVVVILIILSMHSCINFDRVNNLTPLGNIDIFDITIDKSCCDKPDCECECVTPKTKVRSTVNEEEEYVFNEEEMEGAHIFDQKGIYDNSTKLRIFTNPTYEFKNIIAPLSTNVYQFVVRNNNDFNITYNIKMEEENPYNINMKYRLKLNYSYVKGDEETWVTYEDLELSGLELISNGGRDVYQLEWKWFESENDTYIGTSIDADYTLKISFDGEELL